MKESFSEAKVGETLKTINTKKGYTPEEIDYLLDKSRDSIPDYARSLLAESLALLPTKVIDFIIDKYVFISLEDKSDAETFPFNHFYFRKKAGFILIGGKVWKKSFLHIAFTIAHEAAHAFKKHTVKNVVHGMPEEATKREKEANGLAVEWLSKHFKKGRLLRFCHSVDPKK
jgi:Zn-dependent peptidase ImmA (M78 family)